jgi:osmotically-inducible protein OsmY
LSRPLFAFFRPHQRLAAIGLVLLAAAPLQGCIPLMLGGAVGSAFMATDRRTSGTQLEDQGIELKGESKARDVLADRGGHVNVNAYNRQVLLTGEVPNDADKAAVEQAVAHVENVTGVVNELSVSFSSSLSSRSSDVLLAGKVRATLVDARDLMANAFKVVVERGEVYLMGMVTEREANRAAELTSTIKGVRRVVKVMQVISEDELAGKLPRPPAYPPSGVSTGQGSGQGTQP